MEDISPISIMDHIMHRAGSSLIVDQQPDIKINLVLLACYRESLDNRMGS